LQENIALAEIIKNMGALWGGGDLNLDVSREHCVSHTVMKQITADTGLKYHPAPQYMSNGQLCQQNVSNVHDSTHKHCYDMCLVPASNTTFAAKIFAIPGDVAYLRDLRVTLQKHSVVKRGPVVHCYNTKRSDHHVLVILSL